MKKNINYILSILSVFVLAACADKLDIDPINTIDESKAISTSGDVEALMVGAYSALSDGDLYGGSILRDAELIGDDGEIFWDGTFVAPQEIFSKSMLINNDQAEATWLDAYETILICNTVLENLAVVTADKVERVEGEAKFIRAALYFELVRTYGKTWTDGDPNTNPGVPLVTSVPEDPSEKVGRSSVADVYEQVISDFEDAILLLPEENGFFANRFAAMAMLSRVYLMQNEYLLATQYADDVISSGYYELEANYADAFNKTSPATTSEDIFSIQVTDQDGVNDMNTFFASADYGGRGDIYIEPAHFALYDLADARLELFYDGERSGKWMNVFGNVNIIRLSEMYLTRAEGNIRTGGAIGDSPLNDVNAVRSRVNLPDLVAPPTVDQVLSERHLELAFEGHLIHDIKRTQGNVGALTFDAPELIFPIPLRERNINPSLQQNEGYGN